MKKKKKGIEGLVFPLLLINESYRAAYVTDKLGEKKKIKKFKKAEIKSEKEPTRMLNKSKQRWGRENISCFTNSSWTFYTE